MTKKDDLYTVFYSCGCINSYVHFGGIDREHLIHSVDTMYNRSPWCHKCGKVSYVNSVIFIFNGYYWTVSTAKYSEGG